jgi:hypothetical protein
MQLTVPRRHSARTLVILLFYYGSVGLLGVLAAALVGASFVAFGIEVTPERFALAFFASGLVGLAIILLAWHHYVRPSIRRDRAQAFADFEALKRQYGVR